MTFCKAEATLRLRLRSGPGRIHRCLKPRPGDAGSRPTPHAVPLWAAFPVLQALGAIAAGGVDAQRYPATEHHYVYVAAESADLLHRIRLGPDGAVVENTIEVGELATETEGPHGLNISGPFLYMTTAHGVPDGKLWKFHAGPDTLVGDPILLGYFPATLALTGDGLYAFVANFNLHGEMVPSTVSVVYTPEMIEVEQVETCAMPHGARMGPAGVYLYSVCMMDDQVVEIDTRTFEVSRRFSVAVGAEGALATGQPGAGAHADGHAGDRTGDAHLSPSCSPTWVVPAAGSDRLYVACNRGDRVVELDRASWSVTHVFETGPGPYNLALTPDDRILVATLKGGAAVQFFDTATRRSIATAPTSTTVPHGVAVSLDGRYAFVSVEGVGAEPGKVDIFELENFERIADVEVGQQAGGIVVWRMASN